MAYGNGSSTRRRDESRVNEAAKIGRVKWFNRNKGFGFIQPEGGGKDVFVHVSAVERAGLHSLSEGEKITFDIATERGRYAAVNLKTSPS